jgi:hypothetical protein
VSLANMGRFLSLPNAELKPRSARNPSAGNSARLR